MTRALALAALAALVLAAPAAAGPPGITYTLSGDTGDDGWYTGPVTVKWTVSGETRSEGCDTRTFTADTAGATATCSAENPDGTVSATTRSFRIDRTPPSGVAATAARTPDHAGWHTAPVAVTWAGADATSGIAACTSTTYAGPDDPGVALPGTCRDQAGNVSAPVAYTLAYDATAPALGPASVTTAPGQATVRWTAPPDAAWVTVAREPGEGGAPARTLLDGPPAAPELVDGGLAPGTAYTWTVSARDAAGNTSAVRAAATTPPAATTATSAAGAGPRVVRRGRPVVLRWPAVRRARYYNVQLLRDGRKVLTAWPTRATYRLPRAWRHRGLRRRLVAGSYRWLVWPGYGKRAERRYGRLRAQGRFVVR